MHAKEKSSLLCHLVRVQSRQAYLDVHTTRYTMVWGAASRGIDDLVDRLRSNDATLSSLCLLRTRRFNEEDAMKLCDALIKNTVLVDLNITSHPINPCMATAFGNALACNSTLHTLSLGNTNFGDDGLKALAPGLAANKSLKHLDLEQKGITQAGCSHLATALSATLCTLTLSNNAIGDAGLDELFQCPKEYSIEHLYLKNCSLEGKNLAKTLTSLSNLKTLHLHDNKQLCDIKDFAETLHSCASHLTDLSLSGCSSIKSEDIHLLATNFPPHIDRLDISCTRAGQGLLSLGKAIAARNIANVESGHCSLQRLSIASCQADDEILSSLIGLLSENGPEISVQGMQPGAHQVNGMDIDLSCNAVGELTVRALSRWAHARSICLHDCKLGSLGAAEVLLRELSSSTVQDAGGVLVSAGQLGTPSGTCFPALEELDLSGNGLQSQYLVDLLDALCSEGNKNAPVLHTLVIAANPGSNDEHVIEAVQRVHDADHRSKLMIVRRNADTGEQPR